MMHPYEVSTQTSPDYHPLLRVEDLAVSFPAGQGRRVRAVNGINLSIYPGQTLAVVGESGCGKSVSAMSTLRLVPTPPGRYDSGHIWWYGHGGDSDKPVDLLTLPEKQLRRVRGNQITMVFQEPMTSLNPVYTIGEQILEAIRLHQRVKYSQAIKIAVDALAEVGISAPRSRLEEYPHQLSGGMRQRVMIAMALACQPRLLLADEPTTALDVTIQAQILELLQQLQRQRGMAIMLITHDLGVVAENADVVAVMYAGRVVEYATVYDLFNNPLHPYTQGLFASMPVMGSAKRRLPTISGSVPNPANVPTGCAFHPRCKDFDFDTRCKTRVPALLEAEADHWVACWHSPRYSQGKPTAPDLTHRRDDAVTGAMPGILGGYSGGDRGVGAGR